MQKWSVIYVDRRSTVPIGRIGPAAKPRAAALFRLEHSRSYAELQDILASLVDWLKSPEQLNLRRAFAIWLGRVILPKLSGEPAGALDSLEEMRAMLADRFDEWAEEFKREGEVGLLERQIRRKFGDVPNWVLSRLQRARPDELERWGERLLETSSLDELFDGE